jgi:hypothetical protein
MNSPVHVPAIEDHPAETQRIQVKLHEAESNGWHLPHFEVPHVDRLHKALGLRQDGAGPAGLSPDYGGPDPEQRGQRRHGDPLSTRGMRRSVQTQRANIIADNDRSGDNRAGSEP